MTTPSFCQGDYDHPVISVEGILITMSFLCQEDFDGGILSVSPLELLYTVTRIKD